MTLPAGVQRELDQLSQRTGYTPALRLAAERLPYILALNPYAFESQTEAAYWRMDWATNLDVDTEETDMIRS